MQSDLIYDIGMHVGQDTNFYLQKGFRVVAIEANPALCAEAKVRFQSQIESGQLTIVNKAIGETKGSIDFYLNDKLSVWGTANPDWVRRNEMRGAGSSRAIKVEATTIGDILNDFGMPHYMKIDIEGSDILCLSGLLPCSEKPKFVSVESNETSFAETWKQFEIFKRLGYKKYKIIAQHNIADQKPPSQTREGKAVDFKFEEGASGLFGEETPGEWQSLDEVTDQYNKIYFQARLMNQHTGIFRNIRSYKVQKFLSILFPLGRGWYDTHATF